MAQYNGNGYTPNVTGGASYAPPEDSPLTDSLTGAPDMPGMPGGPGFPLDNKNSDNFLRPNTFGGDFDYGSSDGGYPTIGEHDINLNGHSPSPSPSPEPERPTTPTPESPGGSFPNNRSFGVDISRGVPGRFGGGSNSIFGNPFTDPNSVISQSQRNQNNLYTTGIGPDGKVNVGGNRGAGNSGSVGPRNGVQPVLDFGNDSSASGGPSGDDGGWFGGGNRRPTGPKNP